MTDGLRVENAIRKVYDLRNDNDIEAIMGLLAPSCSFRIAGTDRLAAFTQRYDTPEILRGVFAALIRDWDLSGMRTASIHECGDTVFAHRVGKLRFISTDTTVDTEILDKITFKDGLIVDFVEFVDTYLLAKLAGMG